MSDFKKKGLMIAFIACLLSMPAAAFITGRLYLGLTFIVFYVCFGLLEWLSTVKRGKTISQSVWELDGWKKWLVIGCMILGWTALILHFLRIM